MKDEEAFRLERLCNESQDVDVAGEEVCNVLCSVVPICQSLVVIIISFIINNL